MSFEFNWFKMMFLGSVWSLVTVEGQTSKNIHDMRKVCLRKCLCVFMCFSEVYMFGLIEIDVEGY